MVEKKLDDLQNTDIESICRDELVELLSVQIKQELPQHEKIRDFIEQIRNPYCFLCNGVPVKVCFSENGPELSKILEKYFIRLKQS